MFRLLKANLGTGPHFELAEDKEYTNYHEAQDAAKRLCLSIGKVHVVQDVAVVELAPTVVTLTNLTPPEPVQVAPMVVYRGPDHEPEGPPRVPQAKPRLLVSVGRPSKDDYMKYLMVVAEGKIVKNAFGALTLEDMPLTGPERAEVVNALGAGQ
jgi:hypothetical protein